ncbi:unnamed protein product [Aphanomyces euteiches]|uniref:Uncharacterized protein n=1 Tax=Aphanomyces euteiches TaxID=100861 RepID=A0A6G0WPW4_9STRA|nr:hypothetical protein Ae201684_012921 [Aphanomyces euteiches]KAH9097690.1 hypothetical protein Ae201684P_001166 [Aphanomyces euteiches]KAH9148026.1 hypothetical protein AeRB84_008475 [Aphanomyces euteiches]
MSYGISPVELKRISQSNRDRKYRAKKKLEHKRLIEELETLQDQHETNKFASLIDEITSNAELEAIRLHDSLTQNQTLRANVDRMNVVCKLLHDWVRSLKPSKRITPKGSWLHSTLLAHPAARVHGYKWFSDRIYHAADSLLSEPPFENSVEDEMQHIMHTELDEDGLRTIGANELRLQRTHFYDFKATAHLFWNYIILNNFVTSSLTTSSWIADSVDSKLVYHCVVNEQTGTTLRRILRMYEEPNRVVITFASIANDECYPWTDSELRTHGYAWAIFERVSDSMTIARFSTVHSAPITPKGAASLEQIGQIYGKSAHGIEHREAYIEHVRAIAEKVYLTGFRQLTDAFAEIVIQAATQPPRGEHDDDDYAVEFDLSRFAD